MITIKSKASGLYVRADNYGKNSLIANRVYADDWELFTFFSITPSILTGKPGFNLFGFKNGNKNGILSKSHF